MVCRYCGKRLALLKRLANEEFCSKSHHQKYLEEQNLLALARLEEARQRFIRPDARKTSPTAAKAHQAAPSPDLDVGAFVDDRPLLYHDRLIYSLRVTPHAPLAAASIPALEMQARSRSFPKGSLQRVMREDGGGRDGSASVRWRSKVPVAPTAEQPTPALVPAVGVALDKPVIQEEPAAPWSGLLILGSETHPTPGRAVIKVTPLQPLSILGSTVCAPGAQVSRILAVRALDLAGASSLVNDAAVPVQRHILEMECGPHAVPGPVTAPLLSHLSLSAEGLTGGGIHRLEEVRAEAGSEFEPATIEPLGPVVRTALSHIPAPKGRPCNPALDPLWHKIAPTVPSWLPSPSHEFAFSLAGLARATGFSLAGEEGGQGRRAPVATPGLADSANLQCGAVAMVPSLTAQALRLEAGSRTRWK